MANATSIGKAIFQEEGNKTSSQVKEGKILSVDEYWGDDGSAPQWRQELNIGMKIK